jgi:hypothetical protein
MNTIPVSVLGANGKKTSGEVQVHVWTATERLRRGLRWLGMIWGGAVVAVFIPGLHFVLVPSLLIAGPIVAFKMHGQVSSVTGGNAECPACGAKFALVGGVERWPLKDVCASCFHNVSIERA